MSSAVVFIEQSVPEKNLEKVLRYKAYLSPDMQDEILNQIALQIDDIEDWKVTMHVNIELKKYKK